MKMNDDDDDQYVPLAVKLLRSRFSATNENPVMISSFINDDESVDRSPPVKRPRVDSTEASDSPLSFRRLLDDMVNKKDQEYYGNLTSEQLVELGSQMLFMNQTNVDALCARSQTLRNELVAVKERNIALEKDLAAVKESLEAKAEAADKFHKAVDIRLRDAREEGRLQGFNTCREQFKNLGHLPEGFDFDFLNMYADGMGRLDVVDGASGEPPLEAAVPDHLIKDAVLSVELRKKFMAALEPLFGRPVEVDPLFFRRATFRSSSGRFTFLVHFSLSLQFPEHQPVLLLESSQHFDAQGVPVKSQNLTAYPWSLRWEASEMAGQIFDFLAEEGLCFKKYCNQLNQ